MYGYFVLRIFRSNKKSWNLKSSGVSLFSGPTQHSRIARFLACRHLLCFHILSIINVVHVHTIQTKLKPTQILPSSKVCVPYHYLFLSSTCPNEQSVCPKNWNNPSSLTRSNQSIWETHLICHLWICVGFTLAWVYEFQFFLPEPGWYFTVKAWEAWIKRRERRQSSRYNET